MFPQSMFTGYSDITKTRQYSTINGKPYMTYNKVSYDGYNITSEFVSPFKKEDPLHGSDCLQNVPDMTEDTHFYGMLTNIYRYIKVNFKEHVDIFGLDAFAFGVDDTFLASSADVP
jgi:hypothetical protein